MLAPTTKEIRQLQQQVRADFELYQSTLGLTAKKAVEQMNADLGSKLTAKTTLEVGKFRQLSEKRLTDAEYTLLALYAGALKKRLPASGATS